MYTLKLPQAQKDMQDGTVLRWLKSPGDAVKKGETLVEIETARCIVEVQADQDATLGEILAQPKTTVTVGGGLATMSAAGKASSNETKSTPAKSQATEGPKGEVIPILMPKAGNTMEEGTIVEWKVKEGDQINKGDVIFEVETDKATVEVEAQDAGRLARIVLPDGETCDVLAPVAYLADNDEDVDAFIAVSGGPAAQQEEPAAAEEAPAAATAPQAPVAAAAPAATTESGRVKASPAARKLASERGVDLASVAGGSGPRGRIISTDVPTAAPAAAAPAAAMPAPVITEGQVSRNKLTPMRKAIARNLLASKQNIPHFYIEVTIDADPMMTYYQREKAKYRCSVNDVLVKACAKCLQEFPAFRSQIDGEEMVTFPSSNIGIAVGIDGGLVVPVVKAIEQMTLQQSAAETRRIVEAARGGKIENMGQGVFTISNLGMFGIERFGAIINPPEASILAIGAVREEVIVSGGTMRPGRRMTMNLSCDHRIVDGLAAAKFLARLKDILEAPELLLN